MDVSVIATAPDLNVTTGVDITSEAVNVSVTTSFSTAWVGVALFEAMLTPLKVGAIISLKNAAVGELLKPVMPLYVECIAVASINIPEKSDTLATSQPRISWLKTTAFLNICCMFVTLPVSQLRIS